MASRATARLAVPITELQKKTAQAIVNIFETSHIRGDYGMVTLLVIRPSDLRTFADDTCQR